VVLFWNADIVYSNTSYDKMAEKFSDALPILQKISALELA
jgi:hypothetical protein